jgi:anti-sigma factor RsiW
VNARDTTHELYEQLAVGHALSALEPEDEQAFLAHLPSCAACQRALDEHLETLGHLAYDADDVEPPAALLEGIRAGIAESGRAGAFPQPLSLDAARTRRTSRTVRMTTALIGVAASIVLVAALLLVNAGLQSRNHDLQRQDAAFRTTVQSLLVHGARPVNLTGKDGRKAVAVVHDGTVSLVLSGVAANDRTDSIYVLWAKSRFGDVRAVGAFDVRSSELAVVNDLKLSDGAAVKTFMVTREQGRKAPPLSTQQPVVAGDA